jgi:Leucine-rich repeat (LRR) protein
LTSLPSEIGLLTNLQRLYLYYNKLTSLPSEIGLLTNLQELYLNNNNLTSIPSEIGQLTNLQILWLNNNNLTSIPPEIGLLTNLQRLYLNNNNFLSTGDRFIYMFTNGCVNTFDISKVKIKAICNLQIEKQIKEKIMDECGIIRYKNIVNKHHTSCVMCSRAFCANDQIYIT